MYFIFDKMPIQESICYIETRFLSISRKREICIKAPLQILAQYIGFLIAKNKGFYEDEGLEVEIVLGTSTREGSFD
jgi:hypothetical protein